MTGDARPPRDANPDQLTEHTVAVVVFTTVRAENWQTASAIASGAIRKALADAPGVSPGTLPATLPIVVRRGPELLSLTATVHRIAELGAAAASGFLRMTPTMTATRDDR